jgi:tRNA A-37 threonylcarbamoyl transferase component Bud32
MENAENSAIQATPAQPVQAERTAPGFVTVSAGACALVVRSDLRQTEFLQLLAGGEAELDRRYVLERIGSALSSRVFRFSIPLQGADSIVYYKEYVDRSVWDALKHTVRASRARRAFAASMMMAEQGFNVPEVVAVGQTRTGLLTKGCFLLTSAVMASQPVYVLLAEDSSGLDTAALRRKRDLIRTLGHTIGRMHRQGIVHGDLRPGNILARWADGRWQLFFLDNERTRRWPWMPTRLRRKNLVQVGMVPGGVSRTDYLRFWRAYLAECPQLRPRHKQWARRVYARTLERLKKYNARRAD